jgi:hypothetical protein
MTEAAAFRPLEPEYKVNGFIHKLVKREGKIAMYQLFDPESDMQPVGYEVFEVTERPEEYVGPKRYLQPAREAIPLPSQWGAKAFSPSTRARADERFEHLRQLIVNRAKVVSGTATEPKDAAGSTKKRSKGV